MLQIQINQQFHHYCMQKCSIFEFRKCGVSDFRSKYPFYFVSEIDFRHFIIQNVEVLEAFFLSLWKVCVVAIKNHK